MFDSPKKRKRIPAHLVADFINGTGYYATKRGRKAWEARWTDIIDGAIADQQAVMKEAGMLPPEWEENFRKNRGKVEFK